MWLLALNPVRCALQIGQQYLGFLLDQRRFTEAASLTPRLLQVSQLQP